MDPLATQREYARLTRAGDVEGSRAMFAPDAVIWHNYDDRAVPASKAVQVLGRIHRAMPGVRWEDVSVLPTPSGFVWQAVMAGEAPDGPVRAHTCVVATVSAAGLIERMDEYLDLAAVSPLRARP